MPTEPDAEHDSGDHQDPRLVEVITAGGNFLNPSGPLHRWDQEKRCYAAPEPRTSTDLVTALVGEDHRLCKYCEWPDGAHEVVENAD